MFSLVICFYPHLCQWVLASSRKTYLTVFQVIRLSWKRESSRYYTSSVDVSERSNPQSSTSVDKDTFLLMILVHSYCVMLMSYYVTTPAPWIFLFASSNIMFLRHSNSLCICRRGWGNDITTFFSSGSWLFLIYFSILFSCFPSSYSVSKKREPFDMFF